MATIAADPAKVTELESRMFGLWEKEADRVAKQEATEMEKGFESWQFAKLAVQAVLWVGWIAILGAALFGGNLGVKPLIGIGDVIKTWGEVTTMWLVVYNGGHTVKAVFGGRTK